MGKHDMIWVVRLTFFIDTVKTIGTFIFWLHYKPGWLANAFNRIPTIASQIELAFLIHLVMDVMQSSATAFTLYIVRYFRKCSHSRHQGNEDDDSDDEVASSGQSES